VLQCSGSGDFSDWIAAGGNYISIEYDMEDSQSHWYVAPMAMITGGKEHLFVMCSQGFCLRICDVANLKKAVTCPQNIQSGGRRGK
jgi:hypothetical protein